MIFYIYVYIKTLQKIYFARITKRDKNNLTHETENGSINKNLWELARIKMDMNNFY